MKTLIAILIASAIAVGSTAACPHCNIYNYLAGSIESSTEIQLVKVIKMMPENTARFEVLEVIRGDRKIGDTFEGEFYGDKSDIGETLIWSNPSSWPPNFPRLPSHLNPEIQLLVSKDKIETVETAVTFLQGVSRKITDEAEKYTAENYDQCRVPLIDAFDSLYGAEEKWDETPFLNHRFEQIVKALLQRNDPKTIEALETRVHAIAVKDPDDFSAENRPFRGEPEGAILKALVADTTKPASLKEHFRAVLFREMPLAKGSNVRWFTYALGTGLTPELERRLKELAPEQHRAAAFGIYDLSEFHRSWWAIEDCDACRTAALRLDASEDLTALAKAQEERLKFFRKTKKR